MKSEFEKERFILKVLETILNKEEKKIFKITVKPYIVYSIINTLFVIMARYNIGNLNSDVQSGLITSWMIYSFVLLFTVGFYEVKAD